jgi:hypothetical protein
LECHTNFLSSIVFLSFSQQFQDADEDNIDYAIVKIWTTRKRRSESDIVTRRGLDGL